MRLDTKKVDKILLEIADKVGVYISINIDRAVHPDYVDMGTPRIIEAEYTLYLNNKVKLEDGTILQDEHIKYKSSKELFDILVLLKKGIKIDE
jgi:hypothetical protein